VIKAVDSQLANQSIDETLVSAMPTGTSSQARLAKVNKIQWKGIAKLHFKKCN